MLSWNLELSQLEAMSLRQRLDWLVELGHVAAYSLTTLRDFGSSRTIESELRSRLGDIVLDAIATTALAPRHAKSVLLVPVSGFQPDIGGSLIGSARFLGTELPLAAVQSFDEEIGFPIPGQNGLYLPLIMPFSAWR